MLSAKRRSIYRNTIKNVCEDETQHVYKGKDSELQRNMHLPSIEKENLRILKVEIFGRLLNTYITSFRAI